MLSSLLSRRSPRHLALLFPLFFLLTGCPLEGDDGKPGEQGPPGEDAVVVTHDAEKISAEITDVQIGSPPVVTFEVRNEFGTPYAGVSNGDVAFTFAKLVPGVNGDASAWQSYINQLEEAGSAGPGTVDQIQSTTDSGGELVHNGDGTYTYTFGTDVTSITDPMEVEWEPSLTHRIGLRIGSRSSPVPPPINITHDFQPSTGATTGLDTRKIVANDSCLECHNQFRMHGGVRTNVDYCVTCHNPGSTDANSGNTVDFKVMIHKIHRGANLPSVQAGGTYSIFGFRDSEHDYSDVHHPQDVRNCTKCHDENDEVTPDAANWHEKPTLAACGSCHDEVDFSQGESGGHPGGVVTDNSECTVCHAEEKIAGPVEEDHQIPEKIWAERFEYNVVAVDNTAPGSTPSVTFSITDPTNGDAAYDITSDPEFTGSGARLAVIVGWDTTDYSNTHTGDNPAKPISINALSSPTDNGDGTFTVTAGTAIPSGASGSGAAALEGHPAGDFDGDGTYDNEVPVTNAIKYFAITDSSPVPRRSVVDIGKCQDCHGENDGLAMHGGNRTDNVEVCAVCHNPNNTDIAMRPADPDGVDDGDNTAAADGREDRPIDFKYLIHAIHGAEKRTNPFIVYGFFNSVHDYGDAHFPGLVNDCATCHEDGTYEVPLPEGVLGTTVDTGATVNTSSPFGTSDFNTVAAAEDPSDDGNITPTAAVCSSCHDNEPAKEHMRQNGASFDTTQANIDNGAVIETCAVCHGSGRTADVNAVHGIE